MAIRGPMEWKARAYLSSLTQMIITAGHDSLLRKESFRMVDLIILQTETVFFKNVEMV